MRLPYKRGTATDPFGFVTPSIAASERLTPLEQASILAAKYNVGLRVSPVAMARQAYRRGTSTDPLGYLDASIIAKNHLTPGEVTSIHEAQFKADHPSEYALFKGYLVQRHHETTQSGLSKIAHSASSAVSSVARTVGKAALAPAKLASNVARGQNVLKSLKTAASESGLNRSNLSAVAKYAGSVPGIGTAVGAGASALNAVAAGQSLANIAKSAAIGAIPGGPLAQAAASAAASVAVAGVQGKNLARAARDEVLNEAIKLAPGPAQGLLGSTVRAALSGQNVMSAAKRSVIAAALNQIPDGAARSLVKSAVSGQTDPAALLAKAPGALVGRVIARNPAAATAQAIQSSASKVSTMQTRFRPQFANRPDRAGPEMRGASKATVGATRPMSFSYRPAIGRPGLVHFPMSLKAKVFAHRTSGLGATGALMPEGYWLVQAGDTGSSIAKAMTGNANRWTELKAVNPTIMNARKAQVAKYGFPIYAGDKVNLPSSWTATQQPAQPSSPAPSAPPQIIAPLGDIAAMGQARVQLAAWGASDGRNQAGLTDYATVNDMASLQWAARDKFEAASFENWWNKTGYQPTAPTDGELSPALAAALTAWTEAKAHQSVPIPVTPNTNGEVPPVQPATPPTVVPVLAIGAARPLLIAWSQSNDAPSQVRSAGYGTSPAELAPTWSDRDMAVATAFEVWYNQAQNTSLPIDGALSDQLHNELVAWAQGRLSSPALPPPQAQPPTPQTDKPPTPGGATQPVPVPPKRQPMTVQQKGGLTLAVGILGSILGPHLSKAAFGSWAAPT